MSHRVHALLACALVCATPLPSLAAIEISSPSTPYRQSFNALAASGSAVDWSNDSTLTGWSLFTSAGGAVTNYRADTGSSTAGGFRSYGADTDRALGGLGTASFSGHIGVAFVNATGAALSGFTVGFVGEQWRNSAAAAQTMVFEYGYGNSFAAVSGWTAPGGRFEWTSPVAGGSAGAIGGNGIGQVGALGGTVSSAWQANDTLWLRWAERNDPGNDHGLAIDDFAFSALGATSTASVSPVPEPATHAFMLAGLAVLGLASRRRRRSGTPTNAA